MFQIPFLFIAALAAIGPMVQAAGTCTHGLDYCGHALMQYGRETLLIAKSKPLSFTTYMTLV